MSAQLAEAETQAVENELISIWLDKQLVGIPVLQVQDILGPQRITAVPRAAGEIAGVLNLRGRIVTAIDLRVRLGMAPRAADAATMSVVVDHKGELYSLLIDQVGEVLDVPLDRFEADTTALSPAWRELSRGVFRLDKQLLVLLDVGRVLQIGGSDAARPGER